MAENLCLPTNDEVRLMLQEARRSSDPRSIPALGLLLSQTLSVGRLEKLRWLNWDRRGKILIIARGKSPEVTIVLSDLLQQKIDAIPRSDSPYIFAPLGLATPSLSVLFVQLLNRAGLVKYVVADFLAWSEAQTPSVRISTVTT